MRSAPVVTQDSTPLPPFPRFVTAAVDTDFVRDWDRGRPGVLLGAMPDGREGAAWQGLEANLWMMNTVVAKVRDFPARFSPFRLL